MSHELTWRRLRRAFSKVAAFGRLPLKLIADSPWLIDGVFLVKGTATPFSGQVSAHGGRGQGRKGACRGARRQARA